MPKNQLVTSDIAILGRVLEPAEPTFSPQAARSILALDFRPWDRERMRDLAAKASAGALSAEEQTELANYERVGHLLSLLKAKATVSLRAKRRSK